MLGLKNNLNPSEETISTIKDRNSDVAFLVTPERAQMMLERLGVGGSESPDARQKTPSFIQNWKLLGRLLLGSFLTLSKHQEAGGQEESIPQAAHKQGDGRNSPPNEYLSLTCLAPATGNNHSIRL